MSLGITVRFSPSTYSVNEGAGAAQPVLVLSNPSSTDITVVVYNTNGTAFGEYRILVLDEIYTKITLMHMFNHYRRRYRL